MNISQALRQTHADALALFLHHGFFAKVQDGSLRKEARDAYFHYEHRFVQQAVLVIAHLLIKAPTAEARHHIRAILRGLVTEQMSVFELILIESVNLPPKCQPK